MWRHALIATAEAKKLVQVVTEIKRRVAVLVLAVVKKIVQAVSGGGKRIVLAVVGQVIDISLSHEMKATTIIAREARSTERYTKM